MDGWNEQTEALITQLAADEELVRRELAEARRVLRAERAATRPPKAPFGPIRVGVWAFVLFLAISGWIRCLGIFQ